MALAPVSSFDSFTRSVSSGLGTNDVGHQWLDPDGTASSDSYLSVETTGEAVLTVPTGTGLSKGFRSHYLRTNMGSPSVASRTNGSVVARIKFLVGADTHFAGVSLRNSGGRFIGARLAASNDSMRMSIVAVDASGNLTEIVSKSSVSLGKGVAVWLRFTISSTGAMTASVWKEGTASTTALTVSTTYASWMTASSGYPGFFYGVATSTPSVTTTMNTLYYEVLESPGLPVNAGLPVFDNFDRAVKPGWGYSSSDHLWYGAFADDYEAYAKTGFGDLASNFARATVTPGVRHVAFIGGAVSGKLQATGRVRLLHTSSQVGIGLHGTPLLSSGVMQSNGGYVLSIGNTAAQLLTVGSTGATTAQRTYTYPFAVIESDTGTWLRYKFWIGSPADMRAKVWVNGTAEPANWNLTYSDTSSPTYAAGTPFVYGLATSTVNAGFQLDAYSVATADYLNGDADSTATTGLTATAKVTNWLRATVSGDSTAAVTLSVQITLASQQTAQTDALASLSLLKAPLGGLRSLLDAQSAASVGDLTADRELKTTVVGESNLSVTRLTELVDLPAALFGADGQTTGWLRARFALKATLDAAAPAFTATGLTNTIFFSPTSVSADNQFALLSATGATTNGVAVLKGTARADWSAISSATALATFEFKEQSLRLLAFEPSKVIRAEELNNNFARLQWVLGTRSSSADFVVPKVLRLGRVANAVLTAPTDRTDPVYNVNGFGQARKLFMGFNVSETVIFNEETSRWEAIPRQTRKVANNTSAISLGENGFLYRFGVGDTEDRVVNRFASLFRIAPTGFISVAASLPITEGTRRQVTNDADEDEGDDDETAAGAFPVGSTVRTTDNGLWVRTGPGLTYPHIYTLPYHAVLTITGAPQTSGGYTWYPHTYATYGSTIKGWSAGEYMERTGGAYSAATASATTTAAPQQTSDPAYRLMLTPLETPIPLLTGERNWSAAAGTLVALPRACRHARAVDLAVRLDTKQHHDARLTIHGQGRDAQTGLVCAPEQTQIQFYRGTVTLGSDKRIRLVSPTRVDQIDLAIVGIWH